MRNLLSKRRLVIGTGVVLFLFSLNLVSSQVRGLIVSASSSLQTFLWQTGNDISTLLGGGSLRVEKEALTQKNSALLFQLVALQDVKRENEELRRMLDLGFAQEFRVVMGEVIGKNLMQDVITIRGGQDRGIQKGMPVVTSEKVAVGRVVESFPAFAHVQLVSARESTMDVQITGTESTGVVRGQGGQKLMLDLVPQGDEFKVGDVVITSNLGDVFPKNLLIGEVAEILKTGVDPFQKANVKPFFNLKSIERVFVITSLLQ